ncbi:DUF1765-domain-containing protein [Aaosphaeria arxii CBS 175.79]|uniref:DUF1765-domain-containing protein n=1 Tax=Aaosphaeria arxii CBS 175.79 TaxID=1450172 RepID=A0A6A5XTN7_9PLEO|nr:DUF1765-domain-containing protein [Aaosphaeria arxii CBS 175.79]KAF2016313.1 DUF1765-domain-containing protein [Aaosphaeria arxii CBS 175.79]
MEVAPALTGHQMLANATRGRNRSASDAFPPTEREPQSTQLPKAASYTYFPRVKDLDDPPLLELKGTISEEELKTTSINGDGSSRSSADSSPSSEDAPKEQMPELRPANARRMSRILSFSSKSRDPSQEPKPSRNRLDSPAANADSPKSMSPARSFTKLRRKSWISQSRSSSPTKENKKASAKEQKDGQQDKAAGTAVKSADPRKTSLTVEASKRKMSLTAPSIPEKARTKDTAVKDQDTQSRVLTKKSKRPLSGLFTSSTEPQVHTTAADAPSVPQLPKSFSTEKLPAFPQSPTTPSHIPPIPRNLSSDKLKGAKTEPRKKDELWTVYRTLEADLRKFQSKSTSLKANVLRTTLLPFLRSYLSHPSNQKLRPEDLDRRVNILNGWWTTLMDLLAGKNNQSISGTDRPAILEGIAGIMERPEWRTAPSSYSAPADRAETSSATTVQTAASTSSSSSDFLAESVYHNVRNIFTSNLLAQMTFVIDKMSLRNAAASLVTFCGKTCAYAFCFCPGVADILVRLWNPSIDLLKRVFQESGVSRQDRLEAVSDRVVSRFPPTLHSLKFQSLAKLARLLRQPANFPLGTGNLDWYGSWVKRWSGAESDMFYVFAKHYHILVTEFLPGETTDAERMCVPGLILVHAQILFNIDATINRHTAPQQPEEVVHIASSITFDDVLGDPDTSVSSTLPIPPTNVTRQMAENRLIMLIRDLLAERNSHLNTARRTFAESFGRLMKAAAKRVSLYDNNACYTLCDFMEEAFVILVRYEQLNAHHHSVLEWPFWLSVCKQMAASQNTATEIKLYSFLYTAWPTIVVNEDRKTSLCLDFLLEPDFFESRFNHWCPMVRSYFMRLLCWRVARFDGDGSAAEITIIKALSDRLRSVWSHYLWLHQDAETKEVVLPSTTACNPAPGRRFLIIRNDNPAVSSSGPFISFDGVLQSPTSRRLSASPSVPDIENRPVSAQSTDSDLAEEEPNKGGRWSLFRNLIGGSKQSPKAKSSPPKKENDKSTSHAAADTSAGASQDKAVPSEPAPSHRSYSFRFSLEWVDKRFGVYQNMRLSPPRLPLPAQTLLQDEKHNIQPADRVKPIGPATSSSRYAGRALAEWTFISHECQNFFDRRKNEGVPSNKLVETPTLAVEAFRRPG